MSDLRIAAFVRGRPLRLVVNGRTVTAFEGETVQAALLAAGYRVLRQTRRDRQPRGFFCGMGVCCECLVTINGVPNQRACMTPVQDRMEIRIDAEEL
jgi:sarcosine oxidase subunit alpha